MVTNTLRNSVNPINDKTSNKETLTKKLKTMNYDFNELVNREGTASFKYETLKQNFGRDDLLPLWIADMEFRTAPCVTRAIQKRLDQDVFGYSTLPSTYYDSIINWLDHRYQMKAERKNLGFIGGIVPGVAMALCCLTKPGDTILVNQPVYFPFNLMPGGLGRRLIFNPLKEVGGRYEIDIDDFRNKARQAKMFILCNPQNPGGTVWREDELREIIKICREENTMIISDEIHADLTLPPHKHTPLVMIDEAAKENTITFMAPSKAFNMPGIMASHYIVYNEEIKKKLDHHIAAAHTGGANAFAAAAVQAAYTQEGEQWLEECLHYIKENIQYVEDYLQTNIPQIRPMHPEASFLLWLDCRQLGLTQDRLVDLFVNGARLALNDGSTFGQGGTGYMRLNVACPRSLLEEAMKRLCNAIHQNK